LAKHIKLHARKVLSGRIAAYERLAAQHTEFRATCDTWLEEFLTAVRLETQKELDAPVHTVTLEDYLQSLGQTVENKTANIYREEGQEIAALTAIVRDYTDTLKQQRFCTNCVPDSAQICCAARSDHDVVARYGKCIRYFKDTFTEVLNHTRYAYQDAGCTEVESVRVEFCTEYTRDLALAVTGDPQGQYNLSGRANFSAQSGDCSFVTLLVDPGMFSLDDYHSVPYVLMHECVCHAYQRIGQTEVGDPPAFSAFAEGWMDRVALELMRRQTTSSTFTITPANEKHAVALHDIRHTRVMKYPRRASIKIGVDAAQRFIAFLGIPQYGLGVDPVAVWLRLSLALNTSRVSFKDRDRFAREIYILLKVLASPRELPALHAGNQGGTVLKAVHEAVTRYWRMKNVPGLVIEIHHICEDTEKT